MFCYVPNVSNYQPKIESPLKVDNLKEVEIPRYHFGALRGVLITRNTHVQLENLPRNHLVS